MDLYLPSSYSDDIDARKRTSKDNAMNTTAFTAAHTAPAAAPRAWFKVIGAHLRHALETLGKPYVNGQFPSY